MTPSRLPACALFASLCLSSGVSAQQEPPRVDYAERVLVEVRPQTEAQRRFVRASDARLMSEGESHDGYEVLVTEAALDALDGAGVPYMRLDVDVAAQVEAEWERVSPKLVAVPRSETFFDDFRPLDQIDSFLDQIVADHPGLIAKEQIGTSVEGRPIWGFTISAAPDPDAQRGLMINGTLHAREWISPATMCFLIDRVTDAAASDPRIATLLENVTLYVAPVINPDGYVHSWTTDRLWRKNRRDNGDGTFGVDLNRNFDWSFSGPGASATTSSEVYHGPAPFSEPETRALRDWLLAKPNTVAHIDFHSYSQLVLWPFGDFDISPPEPDATAVESLGRDMADAVFESTGQRYAPMQAIDLYPAAGTSSDWVYGATQVLSWTVELRPSTQSEGGFTLAPQQIVAVGEENLAMVNMLLESIGSGAHVRVASGEAEHLSSCGHASLTIDVIPLPTSDGLDESSLRFVTRVPGDEFESGAPLAKIDPQSDAPRFVGDLGSAPCGRTLEWGVELLDAQGAPRLYPGPGSVGALATVGEEIVLFEDDFNNFTGWGVENLDGLTDGAWERDVPIGAGRADPYTDFDGSGRAYITDNAFGNSDVDSGRTRLRSPVMDASNPNAVLSYARWLHNAAGDAPNEDSMLVEVSDNGGATWTILEQVGPAGVEAAGGWMHVSHRIGDISGITPSDQFRVRFTVEDDNEPSIVEAGVDAVRLIVPDCSPGCGANLDCEGVIDASDLARLLAEWGAGGGAADITGDALVNGADLSALLALWGENCN